MATAIAGLPMDLDGPPPPYSREDPNAHLLAVYRTHPQPDSPLAAGLEDPTTYVADGFRPAIGNVTPAQTHRQTSLPTTAGFSSAHSYFEMRPSTRLGPVDELPHFMVIHPESKPSDYSLPASWLQRDVNLEDWSTFLNYLFPHHLTAENARILARKAGTTSAAGEYTSNVEENVSAIAETDMERRKRMTAVISEWNERFFKPRAVRIESYIIPGRSSSSISGSNIRSPVSPLPAFGADHPTFAYHVCNDGNQRYTFGDQDWQQHRQPAFTFGAGPGVDHFHGQDGHRRGYSPEFGMRVPHRGGPGYEDRGHRRRGHHRHVSEPFAHPHTHHAEHHDEDDTPYRGGPWGGPMFMRGRGAGWRGHGMMHHHSSPWIRPWQGGPGQGNGRRGHRRNHHSFSGASQYDEAENQDRSAESVDPDVSRLHGHGRTQSVDMRQLKEAVQRFYNDTMNDLSTAPENFEQLKGILHAGKKQIKRTDVRNEIRDWSRRLSARSAGSSSSDLTEDGFFRGQQNSARDMAADEAERRDIAVATKESIRTARAYRQQERADRAAERAAERISEKMEKLRRRERGKGREEPIQLRNLSKPHADTEAGSSAGGSHENESVTTSGAWDTPPASDSEDPLARGSVGEKTELAEEHTQATCSG